MCWASSDRAVEGDLWYQTLADAERAATENFGVAADQWQTGIDSRRRVMSLEGIFINGVYPVVLNDICSVQSLVQDQILYLQPYSGQRIVELSDNPPSTDSPVRLFLSLTDDLPTVKFTCEVVGWNDKRELTGRKLEIINTVIRALQPTEDGVEAATERVNLLSVRRMRELSKPFSVSELEKVSDNQPLSTNRQRSGGWSYVRYPTDEWLESHF